MYDAPGPHSSALLCPADTQVLSPPAAEGRGRGGSAGGRRAALPRLRSASAHLARAGGRRSAEPLPAQATRATASACSVLPATFSPARRGVPARSIPRRGGKRLPPPRLAYLEKLRDLPAGQILLRLAGAHSASRGRGRRRGGWAARAPRSARRGGAMREPRRGSAGGRREAGGRQPPSSPCPLHGGSESTFSPGGERERAQAAGESFGGCLRWGAERRRWRGCAWRRAAGRLPRQRADRLPRLRGERRRGGLGTAVAQRGWEPPGVTRYLPLARCLGGMRSETFRTLWAGKKPRTTISHEHLWSASHRKRSEMISGLGFCPRQGQLLRSDRVAQGFFQSHLAKPSKGGDCRATLGNPSLFGLDMKGFLLYSHHFQCLSLFLAHHCEDPGSIFTMVSCQALRTAIMYLLSLPQGWKSPAPSAHLQEQVLSIPYCLCGCPLNSESQNTSTPICKWMAYTGIKLTPVC